MIPLNQNLSTLKRSDIRVYTNLANQTPGCIKLTIGEPDFDTPDAITTAAMASLMSGDTHYAPNQGIPELRKAIAEYETARGHDTTPEQVLVTIGACHALFTALLGLLNPGEEIIVPTPGFGLYETIATIAGAKTVRLDISKTGFQMDAEALNAAITPKTKAIILNSPCNPTGVVFHEESLAVLKAAVLGKPIFIVCDNVYNQLVYGECPDLSLDPELKDQMILCQSFSKPYAMTGWRIGYLTCPDYVMDRLLLLSAAEITSVPTFIQEAAITALETDTMDMWEEYARRRNYICMRLAQMGLRFPEPMGAFYVFPDISSLGMDSATFCTRMIREAGVAAVPGSCFGAEGYIRLSYCCSQKQLEEGLDRMESFIHEQEKACRLIPNRAQAKRYRDARLVRPASRKPCPEDSHEFEGHPFRCRKCGLQMQQGYGLDPEYMESFFNGVTFRWKDSFHRDRIEAFSLSSGDLPVWRAECDFQTMTARSCINGSLDGWKQPRIPASFFEKKRIHLAPAEADRLREYFRTCDFSHWETPAHYVENSVMKACGFYVKNRLTVEFADGKKFTCLQPPRKDFEALLAIVQALVT